MTDGRAGLLDSSLDNITRSTLSTLPARLSIGVMMAGMTCHALGWRQGLGWAGLNAVAEAWVWTASAPQRQGQAQSRGQRAHYLAAIIYMNLVWAGLAVALWLTQEPAYQLWAFGLLVTQMVHAQLFNARSNALLLIVGGMPAVILLMLCASASGNFGEHRWLVVINASLMMAYLGRSALAHRRNAEVLELARAEAVAANEVKSRFLATMSHEMRTPLNGVLGMARALAAEAPKGPQAQRAQILLRSGEDLLALLNDSLDLSKIEAGALTLEEAPFDLVEELEQAAELWRPAAAAKGLDLHCELSVAEESWVLGDATRLRQVLNNLLGNAVKFTETGSVTLRASVGKARDGALEITLEVRDTGCGMTLHQLEHVFDPYAQADPSIARRFGGTGLGLGIARQLVEAMGGAISVQSALGEGSIFKLDLALPRCAASGLEDTQALHGVQIMVVDDNAVNCSVASIVLRTVGAEVATYLTGEAALDQLRRRAADVLLVDINMPGLSGYDVLDAVRREALLPDGAPVIALTGDTEPEAVAAMRAAGFAAVEPKPLDAGRLLTTIARQLAGAATAPSTH